MDEKILIVDDAIFMRTVIRRILQGGGFQNVLEAGNGEDAVRIYSEQKPDMVILDITMPGKSGIDVLEEIKTGDPGAKVIMCSAVGQDMMIQKAIMLGAKDFIVKPFRNEEFLRIIKGNL